MPADYLVDKAVRVRTGVGKGLGLLRPDVLVAPALEIVTRVRKVLFGMDGGRLRRLARAC